MSSYVLNTCTRTPPRLNSRRYKLSACTLKIEPVMRTGRQTARASARPKREVAGRIVRPGGQKLRRACRKIRPGLTEPPAGRSEIQPSRPESAKSSPESPVVAPGKSGGHAGNLGYFRGNFGSCGRVGGRSPGHFRHLRCGFRVLCLVAGVAVLDHGASGFTPISRVPGHDSL